MNDRNATWYRLYFRPAYTAVARLVGYGGIPMSEMEEKIKPLVGQFHRGQVEGALYALTTYLPSDKKGHVQLRHDVRNLCWQLLGPPPEKVDAFYRHGDGTPDELHERKMKELDGSSKPEQPKKRKKRAS
jgi:hypothetical protein